ncbi:MAG: hypothetical protein PHU42_03675 [Patescibacteria group bacterium]|nr:hypothetical protein [Patescibacteria group bacterium]
MEININKLVAAQSMFSVSLATPSFLLQKAERELRGSLVIKDLIEFYYNLINFSITLAHLEDWHWHFYLENNSDWAGKKQIDLREFIRKQCAEVVCFIDIANTIKHADRKWPNYLVREIRLLQYVGEDLKRIDSKFKENGFSAYTVDIKKDEIFFLPVIKMQDGNFYFFKLVAEKALQWWRDFDVNKIRSI